MKFFADLHIHSPYSRATSKWCTIPILYEWAQIKGIHVLGTGDCTHPSRLKELEEYLVEAEPGFYKLKSTPAVFRSVDLSPYPIEVRFILTAEISCIYRKNNTIRKNHQVLLVPNFDSATKINNRLQKIAHLASDGRPILKLDAHDLLEIVLECAPGSLLIPAHIWTPWFSLFGSKSGFNSVEDCFGDLSDYIVALETGLSADPRMIRLVSSLDRFALISSSDSHSPANIGREATIFDAEFNYYGIRNSLTNNTVFSTVEFFPEEGKYFFSGHRKCNYHVDHSLSDSHHIICPVCNKPLTRGVMDRVCELADRTTVPDSSQLNYFSTISLRDIIGQILQVGPKSKGVMKRYAELIGLFGSEFNILLERTVNEISSRYSPILAEAIDRIRKGNIEKHPGFDGQYGKIVIFSDREIKSFPKKPI